MPDTDAWNDTVEREPVNNNEQKGGKGKSNNLFAKYQKQAEEARKAMAGSDEEEDVSQK